MEGLELTCFQIISNVGGARSCFIEAIQQAKAKDFEKAQKSIEEGEAFFTEGHHAHAQLIQSEANGELSNITLLLIHAEDQLMSAEAFKILANEFIDVYKQIG
ncbi:PTS system cellobiose-specific IIA component [Breznakia sp. PF5-3]|uniref:PTS lactose/cellobiose transporter subunit IIA n=1 Tax=unclassified Breznakia TaxID=2623764 RepID=UPI0024053F68|nr:MULTISPECIES: PTS lactose/cellobiose transporter subunit IIA [unclassified Breznakia]MDF9824634.1 PTS system cellobiose-specific IIA component [Breznakia sp. PM6-1]MDF9835570.1 PTS system cellobiose-specific IIA component [Breznakia sp. PF5-3]MDF9838688.1 PTS system cellobiose-specific IIA component [Breznakia sp. PFB2-8]MDF9860719.1 PTS system cellobiose-specific IIA component [Breznakia sp. PH5-24]